MGLGYGDIRFVEIGEVEDFVQGFFFVKCSIDQFLMQDLRDRDSDNSKTRSFIDARM